MKPSDILTIGSIWRDDPKKAVALIALMIAFTFVLAVAASLGKALVEGWGESGSSSQIPVREQSIQEFLDGKNGD